MSLISKAMSLGILDSYFDYEKYHQMITLYGQSLADGLTKSYLTCQELNYLKEMYFEYEYYTITGIRVNKTFNSSKIQIDNPNLNSSSVENILSFGYHWTECIYNLIGGQKYKHVTATTGGLILLEIQVVDLLQDYCNLNTTKQYKKYLSDLQNILLTGELQNSPYSGLSKLPINLMQGVQNGIKVLLTTSERSDVFNNILKLFTKMVDGELKGEEQKKFTPTLSEHLKIINKKSLPFVILAHLPFLAEDVDKKNYTQTFFQGFEKLSVAIQIMDDVADFDLDTIENKWNYLTILLRESHKNSNQIITLFEKKCISELYSIIVKEGLDVEALLTAKKYVEQAKELLHNAIENNSALSAVMRVYELMTLSTLSRLENIQAKIWY